MRGIVLAGGVGSRLWPITRAISKQLVPVYDKPMIYYSLTTLITAGISDILIITAPDESTQFERLLGDGSAWGMRLRYGQQRRPEGIAQALLIAAEFTEAGPSALILGDNIFHGAGFASALAGYGEVRGARVFACPVVNPSECGVLEIGQDGRPLSIEEKPQHPRSNYAIPGLYFYDASATAIAGGLRPSRRGELEISDLNAEFLRRGQLTVTVLDRDTAWFDAGTVRSLAQAAEFVRQTQECERLMVGSPEQAAWRAGFIDDAQLRVLAAPLRASGYGDCLLRLLDGAPPPERTSPRIAISR